LEQQPDDDDGGELGTRVRLLTEEVDMGTTGMMMLRGCESGESSAWMPRVVRGGGARCRRKRSERDQGAYL